ncbi:MAG: prepilin-type N-terminal cleavage/methylation domain-containing protein [Polyangiaceae bacterium]
MRSNLKTAARRVRGLAMTARGMRGFTMVELLAAIVIIALLAALAIPSFIGMMRDRRVVRAALYMADTYRDARSRSLARGIAVSVRWTSDGAGKGIVELREATVFAPGAGLTRTCQTADWSSGSTDTRQVYSYNFAGTTYELAAMKLYDEGGVAVSFGEICFSPEGPAYVRYTANGTFASLAGVPHYEITNTRTGVLRTVFVPPNGVARLSL